MSKRAGTVVTIDDLVDAVGVDAAPLRAGALQLRLQHRHRPRPVGEARPTTTRSTTCSTPTPAPRGSCANAADLGMSRPEDFDPALLSHENEGELLRALAEFPRVVASAAELREPHRVARYLEDTAAIFHRLLRRSAGSCPQGDEPVTDLHRARLVLVAADPHVFANGLGLLGVSRPERM